jgi:hypothetical protein
VLQDSAGRIAASTGAACSATARRRSDEANARVIATAANGTNVASRLLDACTGGTNSAYV